MKGSKYLTVLKEQSDAVNIHWYQKNCQKKYKEKHKSITLLKSVVCLQVVFQDLYVNGNIYQKDLYYYNDICSLQCDVRKVGLLVDHGYSSHLTVIKQVLFSGPSHGQDKPTKWNKCLISKPHH